MAFLDDALWNYETTHGLDPSHEAVAFGKLAGVLTALLAAWAKANGAEPPPTLEQAARMGPADPLMQRPRSLFACPGRGCMGACLCEGAELHNQAVAMLDEQSTFLRFARPDLWGPHPQKRPTFGTSGEPRPQDPVSAPSKHLAMHEILRVTRTILPKARSWAYSPELDLRDWMIAAENLFLREVHLVWQHVTRPETFQEWLVAARHARLSHVPADPSGDTMLAASMCSKEHWLLGYDPRISQARPNGPVPHGAAALAAAWHAAPAACLLLPEGEAPLSGGWRAH